jgi:hypothetical protein
MQPIDCPGVRGIDVVPAVPTAVVKKFTQIVSVAVAGDGAALAHFICQEQILCCPACG